MRNKRDGFTLVELLVVIGIIALLISILLPVLGKARQQANSVWCQSNIRRVGIAFQLYAQNNKGLLPIYYWQPPSPATGATDWKTLILPYFKSKVGSTFTESNLGNLNRLYKDKDVIEGASDQPAVGYYADQALTYSVVTSLFGGNTSTTLLHPKLKPYKLASIHRSSEMMLLGDAAEVGNCFGQAGTWACFQNYVALQGASTNYCQQMTPLAQALLLCPNGIDAGLNKDWTDFNAFYNTTGVNGATSNQLRFRHIGNSTMNALFADGHAGSFRFTHPGFGGTDLQLTNFYPDDFDPNR